MLLSLLALKKVTKEMHPVPCPAIAGSPVLLNTDGSLKTRFAQTGQTPFPPVSAVLGGVPMGGFAVSTIFINEPFFIVHQGLM